MCIVHISGAYEIYKAAFQFDAAAELMKSVNSLKGTSPANDTGPIENVPPKLGRAFNLSNTHKSARKRHFGSVLGDIWAQMEPLGSLMDPLGSYMGGPGGSKVA